MARGLMTALQAALAGVSGGAAGYARYQEEERKRQQEQKDAEERRAMNLATMFERGWQTPEEFSRTREEQKATEPAQRMRIGDQELVRARTPQQEAALERGRQTTMAAKAGTQEGKAKQSAIAAALNAQGSRISSADRALIEAGLLDVKDALPRRGGEGAGTASVMRDINDQVARFIAANMGKTRKVWNADEQREVERPIDVQAEAEQLRNSLLELYGMDTSTSGGSGGGLTPAMSPALSSLVSDYMRGVGRTAGAPRRDSTASAPRAGGAPRRDSTVSAPRTGGAPPRASRPLEFTTTTGRTYRLPEE